MTKLKLSAIRGDKPVKITVELPAAVFRDLRLILRYLRLILRYLQAYTEILGRENGEPSSAEPGELIVPMFQRFMQTEEAVKQH